MSGSPRTIERFESLGGHHSSSRVYCKRQCVLEGLPLDCPNVDTLVTLEHRQSWPAVWMGNLARGGEEAIALGAGVRSGHERSLAGATP